MSLNGEINLALYSFFNSVSSDPPMAFLTALAPQLAQVR
jgi:flavin reductase (DIM6/NTAB) family NADH-FMN oxidoreductase RutF